MVLLSLFGAFLAGLILTPVMKCLARKSGFLDHPSARKTQKEPVPLLGGVAIAGGSVCGLVAGGFDFGALVGPALMLACGLIDDRWSLNWKAKLCLQILAALLAVSFALPGFWSLPAALEFLCVFWLVLLTNAFNLLDNMDGLCGGISLIAGLGLGLLAAGAPAILALSAAGAAGAFLIFNVYPARIFMGDAGSLFLGLLLGESGLMYVFSEPGLTASVAVFILAAVPVFDVSLVFVSRLRRGKNPLSTPGRDHTSHRLIERGYSERQAVSLIWLASLVCTAAACTIVQAPSWFLVISLLMACAWPGLLYFFEYGRREAADR